MIFDTTLYSRKPSHTGFSTMLMIYPRYMRNDFKGQLAGLVPGKNDADLILLLDQAREIGVKHIILDAEGPSSEYGGPDGTMDATVTRLVSLAKAHAPEILLGNFAFPRGYSLDTPEVDSAANDAVQGILDIFDFAAPAVYPFWQVETEEGFSQWIAFLLRMVSESRRCMPGKPCFPVLDLCYADYGWPGPQPVSGPLPPKVLTRMANAALGLAGGIILWGATEGGPGPGGEEFAAWDSMSPWYLEMLEGGLLRLGPAAQEQLNAGQVETAQLLNAEFPGK